MRRPAELALLVATTLAFGDSPRARAEDERARVDVVGDRAVRLVLRSASDSRVRHVEAAPGPTWVDLGASGAVRAYAAADGAVVWPRSAVLRTGGSATFRVEPLREVRVASGEPLGVRLHWVPDRLAVPPGPAARVDALQAWIDNEVPAEALEDRRTVAHVPSSTAWWVFGGGGTRVVVARCSPDDVLLELAPAKLRTLAREPTLGGRPLPRGTLVAPGRLDLAAAASVRTLLELRDFGGAFVHLADVWSPTRLAATDHVTLWHPALGVAWTRWSGDGLDDALLGPGSVRFALRGSRRFAAHVALWPAWPGTGEVFSRPSDRHLRRHVADAAELPVGGLPDGRYRFDYSACAAGGRPAEGPVRSGDVQVVAGRVARVILEPDP